MANNTKTAKAVNPNGDTSRDIELSEDTAVNTPPLPHTLCEETLKRQRTGVGEVGQNGHSEVYGCG